MTNNRGTTYSNIHLNYLFTSKQFWEFSFHEIGIYDLAANIDYILGRNGGKPVSVLGFSESGNSVLALLSTRTEYNNKVDKVLLVSPAVYLKDSVYWKIGKKGISLLSKANNFRFPLFDVFAAVCKFICDQFGYETLGVSNNTENAMVTLEGFSSFTTKYISTKQFGKPRPQKNLRNFILLN